MSELLIEFLEGEGVLPQVCDVLFCITDHDGVKDAIQGLR